MTNLGLFIRILAFFSFFGLLQYWGWREKKRSTVTTDSYRPVHVEGLDAEDTPDASAVAMTTLERQVAIADTFKRLGGSIELLGPQHELTEYLTQRLEMLKNGSSEKDLSYLAMSYGIDESASDEEYGIG